MFFFFWQLHLKITFIHSFSTPPIYPFSFPSSDPILHFAYHAGPYSLYAFMCNVGKLYYLPDTLTIDNWCFQSNLGIEKETKKATFSYLNW
jgi:hypothetical protein